ncbi:hypothetical protein D9M73_291140 [compost metagenome]
MPRNAILGAQSPDELKTTFPILGAVFALGTRSDVEAKCIGLNAVPLEYLSDDLRRRQALENSLIVTELQVMQRRHQVHAISGQALADFAHGHPGDMAMNALAVEAEL